MSGRALLAAAAALASTGCSALGGARTVLVDPPSDWRLAATAADRERLRDWRTAWTKALAEARQAGHSAAIAREGALLDPDSALAGGPIPNGLYRCRVLKLGSRGESGLAFLAYPAFTCRVAAGKPPLQSFAKLSGSQRPVGLIFPGDRLRQLFLGTLVLGDEQRAMQYGRDSDRDLAGHVERIGPARWRLALPYPRFESLLDVIELVPAG